MSKRYRDMSGSERRIVIREALTLFAVVMAMGAFLVGGVVYINHAHPRPVLSSGDR